MRPQVVLSSESQHGKKVVSLSESLWLKIRSRSERKPIQRFYNIGLTTPWTRQKDICGSLLGIYRLNLITEICDFTREDLEHCTWRTGSLSERYYVKVMRRNTLLHDGNEQRKLHIGQPLERDDCRNICTLIT